MAIHESEVQTLLDLSPICNKIIDLDGNLQYMSLAGIRLLKISNVEEHYGQEYPLSFFPTDVRSDLKNCCNRALQGESCSIETKAFDTEGKELWFTTTFIPVFDDVEQIKFVIAASVDITEEVNYRNHLEQLVVERTEEKAELQQHLFQSQKTRAIGSLAAGIAHDFNNVLGMILGNVQQQQHNMQLGKQSFDGLNACFANIENAINRASELTGKLLGFAKKGKFDARPIDINQLVNELDSLLKTGLSSTQKIELKTDLRATNFAEADSVQIHQVIQNLVVNSRDALPLGGEVLVSTSDVVVVSEQLSYGATIQPGTYVLISVKDNGIGIASEIQDSIFDPFFSTKPRESGTGLGLASVWGIVSNHNGYVDLRSQVGQGTVFDVYLPAATPVAETASTDEIYGEQRLNGCVLVVDDEPMIRDVIYNCLMVWGCDVLLASNGKEALSIYETNSVDLVLTDLIMDSMDGLELFYELRKMDSKANVFLMSGYHEDDKIKKAIADGAIGFLKKPFDLTELKKVVQAAAPVKS